MVSIQAECWLLGRMYGRRARACNALNRVKFLEVVEGDSKPNLRCQRPTVRKDPWLLRLRSPCLLMVFVSVWVHSSSLSGWI